MTKKNHSIKIVSFILCLAMLLGLSLLAASASEQEYTPIEWELDPNLEYLYGDEKRYERYYVRGAFYGDAEFKFYFDNTAEYDGEECEVYGESADPHIVSVMTEWNYSCIFVDAEGKEILDSFLDGSDCFYYLEDYDASRYTDISREFVETLDEGYRNHAHRVVNVNELGEAEILEVTAHDKTKLKAYQHGAIYIMPSGSYYYVCFEDLDNRYFDADGYFSYRGGSVRVYELDDRTCLDVHEATKFMTVKERTYVYEYDVMIGECDIYGNPIYDIEDPEYRSVAIVMFVLIVIFIGIVVPLGLLILGLLLAISRKVGRAKCWYALSASAGVWLVSAAVFLLLVLL